MTSVGTRVQSQAQASYFFSVAGRVGGGAFSVKEPSRSAWARSARPKPPSQNIVVELYECRWVEIYQVLELEEERTVSSFYLWETIRTLPTLYSRPSDTILHTL